MATQEFDHFDKVVARMRAMFKSISNATTPMEVSKLEREGLELMRELQFTAPRIWNDFVKSSQERRSLISRGLVSPEEAKPQPQQPAVVSEPKPKKKKTTRKKA